jgi:NTP pyrophosphatase (non-canonical NTP hydrolase)
MRESTRKYLMSLQALAQVLLEFRDERNWAQFHTLRNLIVSLNLEAAELLELTQWKSDEEMFALAGRADIQEALRDECADVLLYLLLIADKAGIDLEQAARAKLDKNATKYPIEKSYGSSRKYSQFEE